MKKNSWLALGLVFVIILGGVYVFSQRSADLENRPNLIFIYADDMDLKLLPYMQQTNALIGSQGATFTNYFVTSPTCCPSRASILRGQYPHNTGVLENSPGFEEFYELDNEDDTLATWLEDAGYRTSYMGKYLNLYPAGARRTHIPPGWDDWHSYMYGPSDNFFYAYTMNENGELVKYGRHDYEYGTDVLKGKALDFIDKNVGRTAPFFLMISVYAPHGPTIPAPRHSQLFDGLEYPKGESFQEEDDSDKPSLIRELSRSSGIFEDQDANILFRRRVQTMQSVDEMIAELVHKLEASGELDNTYIIFTSDNGFHMGEHRLSSGKMLPYEEDIRVPLLIRGPGIQPGVTITDMVANIDLVPTISELLDVETAEFIDGRSAARFLLPQAGQSNGLDWRNALLIEAGDLDRESPVIAFRALRAQTFVYVEYENGELEFYDLVNDPNQMENLAGTLDALTLSTLDGWLEQLKICEMDSCRQAELIPLDDLNIRP